MIRSTFVWSIVLLCLGNVAPAADWESLFNGKDLTGWESVGEGNWIVTADGVLLGRRPQPTGTTPFGPWPVTAKMYRAWASEQAWLYSKREFRSFDLHLEYWLPSGGNSGVSLFDSSRGKTSFGPGTIVTPAHIGYEIQILGTDEGEYITGAIYTLQRAKTGLMRENAWNTMDIEAHPDVIRVRINGEIAAEHAPDPKRPQTGPIGLQLHDRYSWVMFRSIRVRER